MNPNESTSTASLSAASETPAAAGPGAPGWFRRFIAGNPFYLGSAALLLFGINRLAVDPNFLGAEEHKLAFNFSALQLYEILLVGVAVALARRRIWYDSTLLVVLENGLVLVPFILITQAVLIGRGLAAAFCLVGTVLVLLRFGSLRRFIGELNLPPRLLGLGALLLAANVAMPLTFRSLIENGTDEWEAPSRWAWLVVAPALLGLANTLPAPRTWGGLAARRGWLPLFLFVLWNAASAVHLGCVGYVSEREFHVHLLTPLVWVLAWTAWNRVRDVAETPAPFLRAALLALPVAATALSVASADRFLFLTLTGLNLVAYAALCCRRREQPVALQLLLVSGAAWLAGMPEVWGRFLMPEFHRGDWIAASAGTYVLIQALRSRQPLAGVGGAALVLCLPALLHRAALWPPCLELAPAFLLLHSLRWADTEEARAGLLRWLAVAVWVAHACVWSRMDGGTAGYTITTAALFVIAGYLIARWVTGRWAAWVVPAGAALSLLAMPANIFLDWIKASPAGLLAVMGSFLLFGLGTVAALTKHRWHPVSPDPGERMIE